MNNKITLNEAIEGTLESLKADGHTMLYLTDMRRKYNRLLRLAEKNGEKYFTDKLVKLFVEDDKNVFTGEYNHERYLAHKRCIRFLRSFIDSGHAVLEIEYKPSDKMINEGFLKAFQEYDKSEAKKGLSQNTILKNRRPIRYLLEFMTRLGYEKLSDIQHGDTWKAFEWMLEEHYSPSSIATALSGIRRFYEMFSELHKFRAEIPSKFPRSLKIIEVFSDEEQKLILSHLHSNNISFRDAAICLLSFETGLRSIDICNLKLQDIDWKHNMINIVQSKTQRPLKLPLRASYGNLMVKYLLHERPDVKIDHFFISVNAPFKKLKSTYEIIKLAVDKAGIELKGREGGARIFRHNAATNMLKHGIPLPVIAEELGHASQTSTLIYLSAGAETMSELTLSVPEGGDSE